MPALTKSRIKTIDLDRREGTRAQWRACTLAGANRVLGAWALSAPKHGAYDKVSVHIQWENGASLRMRKELQHPSTDKTTDLQSDLIALIETALGRRLPETLTDNAKNIVFERRRTSCAYIEALAIEQSCMLSDTE